LSGNDSEFQKVTWSEVERLIKVLAEKISSLERDFSSITTISRGGLVPARLLADHLGIDSIIVDAKKKIASDSIFVDDIYDSGTTFKKIINRVDNPSKFVYVTLFARRGKKYPKQLIFIIFLNPAHLFLIVTSVTPDAIEMSF
jgi:hypoxanthine phosphoribosyltransferase